MSKMLAQLALPIVFVALQARTAVAQPSAYGANHYEFVQVQNPFVGANNSWATASAAASTSVFNGQNGHLATVTSAGENNFLLSLTSGFSGFNGAWLGGAAPSGWLVGPEAGTGFTYWGFGGSEPNNSGFAYMNIGTSYAGIGTGQWADDSGVQGIPDATFDPVIGYFVEYEGTVAPEPTTLALVALGLGAICVIRRRRVLG